MTRRFAVTFDYLCPFARNAHEHVLAGLQGGADWEVTFRPYSLVQGHVEEDATAVWDRRAPFATPGVLALAAGVAVRDRQPEHFAATHRSLFAARHDRGQDITDAEVVRGALERAGVDGTALLGSLEEGEVLAQLRAEHEAGVEAHGVWGVPTFIGGDRAAFVRLLDRPEEDPGPSIAAVEQVVDLLEGQRNLHEFKQTDLPV